MNSTEPRAPCNLRERLPPLAGENGNAKPYPFSLRTRKGVCFSKFKSCNVLLFSPFFNDGHTQVTHTHMGRVSLD